MRIREYGRDNPKVIVLIHPSIVMWDYFEYVIPLLQEKYHLMIPVLPGYDPENDSDFTGVEEIAAELAEILLNRQTAAIDCLYGCSMGGSIVARFLADGRVPVHSAVMDGGITPYPLPWILTRLIAAKDFAMIFLGKLGGIKLLEKAFATDELSEEDIRYAAQVLKHMSLRTIWRTFESCNNYSMPEEIRTDCGKIEYWYAAAEEKERKADIRYIREHFPQTVFRIFRDTGHGGLAVREPERMAAEFERLIGEQHNEDSRADIEEKSVH